MDSAGFPVTYDLFPGNTNDSLTFTPMSEKVRAQLEIEQTASMLISLPASWLC